MINTSLQGKTVFITGASRGIGRAIALKCASHGANIVIAAKTSAPHPKLPGTIHSVAEEVEKLGSKALAVECDVRDELQVQRAIEQTVQRFHHLDILVNNASAIWFRKTLDTPMKRYDLMHQVNGRGTFATSQAALPYLCKSAQAGRNPHILMLSPPLDMREKWFEPSLAYSISKFEMSMVALGLAAELRDVGVGVNALWPRTAIATAAVEMLSGSEGMQGSRKPDIVADAAYEIFKSPARQFTGQFLIDESLLRSRGWTDEQMAQYAVDPAQPLLIDFFVEDNGSSLRAKM